MQKTYRLAKETEYCVIPFGPMMTLESAEKYQMEMEKGGFHVLIVNAATHIDRKTSPLKNIEKMLKRHALLAV